MGLGQADSAEDDPGILGRGDGCEPGDREQQILAQQAHIDTLAKPADIVRTRVEEGPTVTMQREAFAIVVDAALLDVAKLWPFVALAEKEKALRAWAKNTGYGTQMPGAEVGYRPKTVVR